MVKLAHLTPAEVWASICDAVGWDPEVFRALTASVHITFENDKPFWDSVLANISGYDQTYGTQTNGQHFFLFRPPNLDGKRDASKAQEYHADDELPPATLVDESEGLVGQISQYDITTTINAGEDISNGAQRAAVNPTQITLSANTLKAYLSSTPQKHPAQAASASPPNLIARDRSRTLRDIENLQMDLLSLGENPIPDISEWRKNINKQASASKNPGLEMAKLLERDHVTGTNSRYTDTKLLEINLFCAVIASSLDKLEALGIQFGKKLPQRLFTDIGGGAKMMTFTGWLYLAGCPVPSDEMAMLVKASGTDLFQVMAWSRATSIYACAKFSLEAPSIVDVENQYHGSKWPEIEKQSTRIKGSLQFAVMRTGTGAGQTRTVVIDLQEILRCSEY